MKVSPLLLGLFSLSSGLIGLTTLTQAASAQCVVTDVAVQVAVHGSGQRARQSNQVEIESTDPCEGNTINSASTQIHVGGTEPVVQDRNVRHRIRSRDPENRGGGRTVVVPVEVQIEVDNAADRIQY